MITNYINMPTFDLNEKFIILTDCDATNHLCEYFDVNNIVFNFLPELLENIPLIDCIVDKKDKNKKILLILTLENIEKLCHQTSRYNNFLNLIEDDSIKLIYYETADSLLKIYNMIYRDVRSGMATKTIDFLKNNKFVWWTDMIVGEWCKKTFKNVEFHELQHPFLDSYNIQHFFHLKKEKEKTNTFFCLTKLHKDEDRIHRNWLIEKMQDKDYLKDAITHTHQNIQEKKSIFLDLEKVYGPTWLASATWLDSVPVIPYYEKTYFELLTETLGAVDGDDTFFLTEKTLKPIAMGHPFIVLSTKHFLKNLRGLGFKTFGDFIDESYDECDNIADRVEIISKNLESLDMAGSRKFHQDTWKIREHNREHLLYLHGQYKFGLWKAWNKFFNQII